VSFVGHGQYANQHWKYFQGFRAHLAESHAGRVDDFPQAGEPNALDHYTRSAFGSTVNSPKRYRSMDSDMKHRIIQALDKVGYSLRGRGAEFADRLDEQRTSKTLFDVCFLAAKFVNELRHRRGAERHQGAPDWPGAALFVIECADQRWNHVLCYRAEVVNKVHGPLGGSFVGFKIVEQAL
jgi:hypothetical protein